MSDEELARMMADWQVLKAADDDGFGLRVVFEDPSRKPFLEAIGASVTTNNSGNGVRITLRSQHQDFEGAYLYLLLAEMVVGKTTWIGECCMLEGVLTEYLWRTEETVTEEIAGCPSGDGIYVPKGPLPDGYPAAYHGEAVRVYDASVRISPRRDADA